MINASVSRAGKMKKTKGKGRRMNMARPNKMQNPSNTILKQRPIHQGTASQDESGNLVKSSTGNLTKQIESKLSKCVASLASFHGDTDTVAFECTGIFIENVNADIETASVLTSADLFESVPNGITDNLMIKVRLPSGAVVIGWLHRCHFRYGIAVVKIRRTCGFQEAHLSTSNRVQFESNGKVVAVGRCYNKGMLNFTSGTVLDPASDNIYELMLPTCNMNMAPSGCPLFDFDGNFVGVHVRRRKLTAFVPMNNILELLEHSGTTRHSAADTNDKHGSNSGSLVYEEGDLSLIGQEPPVFSKCKDWLCNLLD